MIRLVLLMSFMVLLMACQTPPKEKLQQFKIELSDQIAGDSLLINISNTVKCPLLINAGCKDKKVHALLRQDFPMVLPALADTTIYYQMDKASTEPDVLYTYTIGDPRDSVRLAPLSFPFPKGRRYKIIQGYNGRYSHQSDYSRYAIDFNTKIGDTICAAANGYVIGVIEGYEHGGDHKKWRDYANFITLYHPEMHLFTQYVHLKHQSVFIEIGDSVTMSQPIGLSGMTGWTDIEHLHFNVLKVTPEGIISTPVAFIEGYQGEDLKKGEFVEK